MPRDTTMPAPVLGAGISFRSGEVPQVPVKLGLRFSTNAPMPSF